MKLWKESLPARLAVLTACLLAVVLLVTATVFYAITAWLVRQGVDGALRSALPATSVSVQEIVEHARSLESDQWDNRRLQVLNLSGGVLSGGAGLPVDPQAIAAAEAQGVAFTSLVWQHGVLQPRTGPDWWQALTPRRGEMRVMYGLSGTRRERVVLELAAPVGSTSESLPVLFGRVLLLAAAAAALCGLIVWRMAHAFYRPLDSIIATADEITTRTLSRRIPDTWSDRTLRRLIGVLNAMMARLQGAFEAQARFVAAAAHELRSPLGAMRAELEVALRRERSPQEYREALAGALEETARLGALAENLLMLARYERGMGVEAERGLPLAPLLERAAAEVRRAEGGEVAVAAPPGLSLDGDPVALERAVANLIRNGLQAGSPAVQVAAQATAGGVEISVRDQGRGLAPEALSHLFEPFFRGDPARRRDGGTGLGLAIVKSVADAHGGRIDVESKPGEGTCVRLWLPARQS